jgi:Ca-activated chloride channel family protein
MPSLACDVALVLALDVSGSVDPTEYRLQAEGLSAALGDGVVSEALVNAKALVAVVQWSGEPHQALVIDWTATDTHTDVATLRARIEAVPRAYRNYSTGIGEALRFSADLFDTAPRQCDRKIIDVSGDGRNNEGIAPETLRERLLTAEIDVNGLAIEGSEDGIAAYYRENVIVGPAAFVEVASSFDDFPRAIRRKLLRELADRFAELP